MVERLGISGLRRDSKETLHKDSILAGVHCQVG